MSWQIESHHRVCFICQILHGALVKYLNIYEVQSEKYLLIKFQIKIKISTTNWLLSMKTFFFFLSILDIESKSQCIAMRLTT